MRGKAEFSVKRINPLKPLPLCPLRSLRLFFTSTRVPIRINVAE